MNQEGLLLTDPSADSIISTCFQCLLAILEAGSFCRRNVFCGTTIRRTGDVQTEAPPVEVVTTRLQTDPNGLTYPGWFIQGPGCSYHGRHYLPCQLAVVPQLTMILTTT